MKRGKDLRVLEYIVSLAADCDNVKQGVLPNAVRALNLGQTGHEGVAFNSQLG